MIKGANIFRKDWHIHGHKHGEHTTKRTWLRHNVAFFLRPLSLPVPWCTQKSTVPQRSESEEWNWSSAMIICAAEGVSSTRKECRLDENSHTKRGKEKKHQNAIKRETGTTKSKMEKKQITWTWVSEFEKNCIFILFYKTNHHLFQELLLFAACSCSGFCGRSQRLLACISISAHEELNLCVCLCDSRFECKCRKLCVLSILLLWLLTLLLLLLYYYNGPIHRLWWTS